MATVSLRVVNADAPHDDPDGLYWTRSPDLILADPDYGDAEKVVLIAIIKLMVDEHGQFTGRCRATDAEIGAACGKSEHAAQRSVRKLCVKGPLERTGSGHRRELRACFKFRKMGAGKVAPTPPVVTGNPARSDGVRRGSTPSEVTGNPPRSDGEPLRKRRGTPPQVTVPFRSSEGETPPGVSPDELRSQSRPAAASSPGVGGTPPPAKTEAEPPPASAPPPPTPEELDSYIGFANSNDPVWIRIGCQQLVTAGRADLIPPGAKDRFERLMAVELARSAQRGWKGAEKYSQERKRDRPARSLERTSAGRSEEPHP